MGKYDIEFGNAEVLELRKRGLYVRGYLTIPINDQRWQRMLKIAEQMGQSPAELVARWVDTFSLDEEKWGWVPPGYVKGRNRCK